MDPHRFRWARSVDQTLSANKPAHRSSRSVPVDFDPGPALGDRGTVPQAVLSPVGRGKSRSVAAGVGDVGADQVSGIVVHGFSCRLLPNGPQGSNVVV